MTALTATQPSATTVKKSIRFSPTVHHAIEQTAANLGLNFSRTVETLVQLGLQDTNTLAAAELHRTVADQGVSRALNRYLKMLSQTVIAANEAKEMAQQAVFFQLCQLAEQISDSDEIDGALSLNPKEDLERTLIEFYKQLQQRGRNRSVRQLKRALDIEDELWQQLTLWGRNDDG